MDNSIKDELTYGQFLSHFSPNTLKSMLRDMDYQESIIDELPEPMQKFRFKLKEYIKGYTDHQEPIILVSEKE